MLIDICISITTHDYNTRNKSVEVSQDSLDKLEQSVVQSIKLYSYQKLTDKNAGQKVKCEKLENRAVTLESNNDLAHYGRCNNVFSGIPENVSDNNLNSTVISVLPNIDVDVGPRDNEV